MTSDEVQRDTRGQKILWKAVEAFGRHGIRGASLRVIARDADVSLTLISHHFGNKPTLVEAAIVSLAKHCAPALASLRAILAQANRLTAVAFIEAWIDYLLAAFGTRESVPYLMFMRRLRADVSLENSLRVRLDVAEPELRRALRRAFPEASEARIAFVINSTRAVLESTLAGADASMGAVSLDANGIDREMLVVYLARAIDASLAALP